MDNKKFCPEVFWGDGHIAKRGRSSFDHHFGGDDWKATGPHDERLGNPVLLMCIDLDDPQLDRGLFPTMLNALPLFSYINHDGTLRQRYSVCSQTRTAVFETAQGEAQPLSVEDRVPSPLPRISLTLRPVIDSEIPCDEDSYWRACDSFLGGDAFLRVGGPPVWANEPHVVTCDCGVPCVYVASIGYESCRADGVGFLGKGSPFYLGELALYFFWCSRCPAVCVETDA